MVFAKYSLARTSSVVDISSSGSLFDQRSQLSPRLPSSGAHEAYSEQSLKISDFTSIQRGLARRQQYVTCHRPDEPTRKAGSRDLAR